MIREQKIKMISTHLSHERAVWLAVVIVSNAIAFGLGNGHTTEHAIKHISQEYGATKAQVQVLKKQVDCEKFRADINGNLAITGGADPDILAQCDRKGNLH